MTAAEAARFGDLVVVSVPFGRYREVPKEAVAGKVVIDTNNYYPRRDGHFEELDSDRTTSSELLQAHLSGARVVKAFNAILWSRLRDDGRPAGDHDRLGIPISGDDEQAKQSVAELIDEIGFNPVDAGTLAEGGRKHQPGTPAYTERPADKRVARQSRCRSGLIDVRRGSSVTSACRLIAYKPAASARGSNLQPRG